MHAPQSLAATPLRGGGRDWGTAEEETDGAQSNHAVQALPNSVRRGGARTACRAWKPRRGTTGTRETSHGGTLSATREEVVTDV
jgi:hypothetical protein